MMNFKLEIENFSHKGNRCSFSMNRLEVISFGKYKLSSSLSLSPWANESTWTGWRMCDTVSWKCNWSNNTIIIVSISKAIENQFRVSIRMLIERIGCEYNTPSSSKSSIEPIFYFNRLVQNLTTGEIIIFDAVPGIQLLFRIVYLIHRFGVIVSS